MKHNPNMKTGGRLKILMSGEVKQSRTDETGSSQKLSRQKSKSQSVNTGQSRTNQPGWRR